MDDLTSSEKRTNQESGKTSRFRPELTWREQVSGLRPGDRSVRIARHRHFRGAGHGILAPRDKATEPKGGWSRLTWRLKRLIIGRPISTEHEVHERLTKWKALAVLSSDALSSVAYAPEAIMRTLVVAGIAALSLTLPISLVIVLLLAVVVTSYQQTIKAYPAGGGSYIVARSNLGTLPGLTAAASLLSGYVLTVAVSVAAGVEALASAFPSLRPYGAITSLGAVAIVTVANLRGIREAGSIFAAPTYVFIASIYGVIVLGLVGLLTGTIVHVPGDPSAGIVSEPLTWFLILSAFARGSAVMTGTEAIADGVPAFKPPESHNARITLITMGLLLGTMFLGISYLASQIGIIPDPGEETVLSQLTHLVAGDSWFYYVVQFATALILFLAANTAYADFPRLLSFLARDRFAPRWFGLRGDRLAFSVGITTLSLLSVALLMLFGSSVERLLPLYALGVFITFTLSQLGMVVRWLRLREPGYRRGALLNGVGAAMTALVSLVVAIIKFAEGVWIILVVVPIFVLIFLLIHRHYRSLAQQLRSQEHVAPRGEAPIVLVPIPSLSRVARDALAFAMDISKRVIAVHVATDPTEAEAIRSQWSPTVGDEVPLVVIESQYRLLIPPLVAYIEALRDVYPQDTLVVVLPEFVPKHWWEHLLHNQTALRLKAALLYEPHVVVASVPYHLSG